LAPNVINPDEANHFCVSVGLGFSVLQIPHVGLATRSTGFKLIKPNYLANPTDFLNQPLLRSSSMIASRAAITSLRSALPLAKLSFRLKALFCGR
jgi:hypothetical protein